MQTTFFNENLVQLELWSKISAFEFDPPATHFTFVEKLARNNDWTLSYAETVITEYKKFLFLCCVSPTGASPSKAVDEAWHLHLTYTQSYWVDLCKNVLGFELHHYPSTGGEKEDMRHAKWYAETLVLYYKVFEATPPVVVWPPANNKRVLVEAVEFGAGKKKNAIAVGILLIPLLISFCAFQILVPFEFTGSQFLVFFTLYAIASPMAFVYLGEFQRSLVSAYVLQYFPSSPSLRQMGSFTINNTRLIQTAVLDLVDKKVLEVDGKQNLIVRKAHLHAAVDNPMYVAIEKMESDYKTDVKEISLKWFRREQFIDRDLEDHKQNIARSYTPATWILLSVLILGGLRIFQGVISGYPVFFLTIEMIGATFVYFLIWTKYRTEILINHVTEEHFNEGLQAEQDWGKDAVKQFAVQGTNSLGNFTNAAVLVGLMFSLSSFQSTGENAPASAAAGGGCGGAGGCSGGGGGGGCGGGCGGCGGGCGGG